MTDVNQAFEALDERFVRLPIEWVTPSKTNPRTHFDEPYLDQLANSVREKGILEPLLVRPTKKTDIYEIVAGECRFRAGRKAALTHVPCLVRPLSDEQALEHQLIENLHRKDLTPLEEAGGFRALIKANPDKHSAASIAERIGKSASWVWDLIKLLELIPEAKQLLEEGRISAGHAILIARLKADEQKRVIHPHTGGLFEDEDAALPGLKKQRTKYDGVKVRTINELKEWIADHIRFDVHHAAKAAPLEFEPVAERVEAAAARPGRGKKVVPITFDHMCPNGAKDDSERTYGATAWKRADGQEKSKTCEHSVMGVVAAGSEHYGEAFEVCIARDRCTVHWAESVKAKQKAAKLLDSGKTKQAAKVEKKAAESYESKWKREQAERNARQKVWETMASPIITDAVAQVKNVKALTPALAKALLTASSDVALDKELLEKHLGANWYKTPVAALLVSAVAYFQFDSYPAGVDGFQQYVRDIAKPFGLDLKRLEAIRDKHQPAEAVHLSGSAAKKASVKKGKAAA